MLNKICNYFYPKIFSEKWFSKHAKRCTRLTFEQKHPSSKKNVIYHVTDMDTAKSIYKSGNIYGIDTIRSAHFHFTPEGASKQAKKSGVVLGFVWEGPVTKVDLSINLSTHDDTTPNQLFDVPISKLNKNTWELRLYPGSRGLELSYIGFSKESYSFEVPRVLSVIHGY